MKKIKISEELDYVYDRIVKAADNEQLQDLLLNHAYIVGGSIASILQQQEPRDYDIYFIDEASVKKFEKLKHNLYMKHKYKSKQADTYQLTLKGDKPTKKVEIQFITKYSGLPLEVIKRFDFVHCMNYYIPKTKEHFLYSLNTVLTKELVFNKNAAYPINALKRISKFLLRGYTIDDSEYMQIGMAISKLKLDNDKVFTDQSNGMYVKLHKNHKKYNHSFVSSDAYMDDKPWKKKQFDQEMKYTINESF